ncbi:hypothetical protein C3E79_00490 [Corynebacterium liangguodongii]|uniref:Uncharacterized protein n=1 Tax=Corynebacterium liangguodongii TaxID=2079535 RepID=A0A2S0WGS6_9CORY|nr:hypothetical protein C3E79_00490 [Corynebacterium liangguodongii]PWB98810.1 hypothetical protein DF219_09950 [Corynebacterium liangguodongii]
MLAAALASTVAPAGAYEVARDFDSDRTALAVVHPDGRWSGSEDALEPRPALSLAKLYLGYWVLYNGTEEDKDLVEEMIALSRDDYAQRLDRKYPQAIGEIADDFDLQDTARYGAWGRTETSAYDVATFIASILWDPRAEPLLDGMRQMQEKARDGFDQLFGAATLDRVEGMKTGWSDDQESQTGSVAFGEIGDDVWVVAALTWGDAEENTADVKKGVNQVDDLAALKLRLRRGISGWQPGDGLPVKFTPLDLG